MESFIEKIIDSNQYVISIIAILLTFVFLVIVRIILIYSLKSIYQSLGSKGARVIQQGISKLSLMFILSISLYVGVNELSESDSIKSLETIKSFLLVLIILSIVRSLTSSIAEYSRIKSREIDEKGIISAISYISIISRFIIWVFSFVFIIESIGFDTNALLTGLGISGLAFAFALRNSIKDVIASFIIVFDKPVQIGDRVVVDKKKGIVEKVGVKSTILVQEDGRRYILPNSFITEKAVKNYQGDESQDFEIQMTIKKSKSKITLSKMLKELLKKNFNDTIKPDLQVTLREISNENDIFQISISLWNRENRDEKVEGILVSIDNFLKENKFKLENLKILDSE